MKFSSQFKNVVAKQIIYLFPGGGFDFYSKFSLDFQPHYISTHPYSSKILKDAGVKFIECLGGPHSRYCDKPDLNNYHKFKSAEKLIVNFSSMGFSAEKGDKKFVTIAKIYRTIFFWHKIQFTSVGNCKKSIFVRNYKIMDFVSLNNFYINFVDIQINMATLKASNGWPLGVEALRAGCVLITTDPNKVSKAYLLSNSLFIVNNIFQVILAIWKLYSKPNYYLDKQRLQRDFYLRNFSYQVQQQKIFDWIYAIFTNR